MSKVSKQKGFTLIELLVVIAIIGILSSVILASLSTARAKGSNAAIQSGLANMRAQAELYNSNQNSYAGVCTTSGSAGGIADMEGAATSTGGMGECSDATSSWSAWAALKTPVTVNGVTLNDWCVGSSGASKATGTAAFASNQSWSASACQ